MLRSIALVSLLALMQSCSASDYVCTKFDEPCENEVFAAPSAAEIGLIRQSWETAKEEKDIPTRIIVAHLQAHPMIAKLFPGLEGVPLSSLATNSDVLNRFRPRVHHALNFIINNLDTPALLAAALPRINANYKLYVDYVTPQQQNRETVRIILKILEQEFGSRLSAAAKAAWKNGLSYAFSLLLLKQTPTTSSTLSASDISLVRQSWEVMKNNVDIPARALVKMFELHPPTRALYPEFANVALDQLGHNKDFLLQASIAGSVLNLLIVNLDDDRFVTDLLLKQTQPHQFVSYVDPVFQNDEIARLFLEAVQEQVLLDDRTLSAWNNVLSHLSLVSASALKSSLARAPPADLSAKRAFVANNWASVIGKRSFVQQSPVSLSYLPQVSSDLFY